MEFSLRVAEIKFSEEMPIQETEQKPSFAFCHPKALEPREQESTDSSLLQQKTCRPSLPSHFEMNRLIRARDYAALLLITHGERFRPVFRRLEAEVKERRMRDEELARAYDIIQRRAAA